jgi:sulfoxide reductase heme-binding subunit YedZ
VLRGGAWVVVIGASTAATSAFVGGAVSSVAGDQKAPWLLGRAAGISSYLLIVGLVCFGLILSHPVAARWSRPSRALRLRIHVSLAVFTLAFTALHIVVLATDAYARVGWRGAVIPGAAAYRPLAVSLGTIGLYAGLLAGLTAAVAGRVAGRIWWPIHKVAVVTFGLVWAHAVQAGSDTSALFVMYLASGAFVVALAASRYVARNRRDVLDARLLAVSPRGQGR